MSTQAIYQTATPNLAQPRHGGDVVNAVAHFGGHLNEWLDLSTGISPWAYPFSNINESVWRDLPASTNNLISAAASFYHCQESALSPTPGSQLAIRLLPSLINQQTTVAIPDVGYQEHAYSWQQAGHRIKQYSNFEELRDLVSLNKVANAVVINPNNPSCAQFSAQSLLLISEDLSGVLLVDEAFADLDDSQSLSHHINHTDNVVILRSLGKFFGLAGARIGFMISQHPLAKQLHELLSPWSINAAAMQVAEQALEDIQWQKMQRQRITEQSHQLDTLLDNCLGTCNPSNTEDLALSTNKPKPQLKPQLGLTRKDQGLFTTLQGTSKSIRTLHQHLAEKRVWTRIGDDRLNHAAEQTNWLRLSLPGSNFEKLATALSTLKYQSNFKHDKSMVS